jgi:hypothetical protein
LKHLRLKYWNPGNHFIGEFKTETKKNTLVSSRGLAIKAEVSQSRGCGFKNRSEKAIYNPTFIWIKAWNKEVMESYNQCGIAACVLSQKCEVLESSFIS